MIFMPSIWTLIAGVSMVAVLAAFQWWLSGQARRFASTHRTIARSFRATRPGPKVARRQRSARATAASGARR
jgi:hypothetical protein